MISAWAATWAPRRIPVSRHRYAPGARCRRRSAQCVHGLIKERNLRADSRIVVCCNGRIWASGRRCITSFSTGWATWTRSTGAGAAWTASACAPSVAPRTPGRTQPTRVSAEANTTSSSIARAYPLPCSSPPPTCTARSSWRHWCMRSGQFVGNRRTGAPPKGPNNCMRTWGTTWGRSGVPCDDGIIPLIARRGADSSDRLGRHRWSWSVAHTAVHVLHGRVSDAQGQPWIASTNARGERHPGYRRRTANAPRDPWLPSDVYSESISRRSRLTLKMADQLLVPKSNRDVYLLHSSMVAPFSNRRLTAMWSRRWISPDSDGAGHRVRTQGPS